MRISRRTLLILAETTGDIHALSMAEDMLRSPGRYQAWFRGAGRPYWQLELQDHWR